MQQDMDTIKFEYRSEIESIIIALEESPKKDDETVQRMIDLLYVMHMCW